MKKYNLNNLDVNVFEHVCKNGLRVYLMLLSMLNMDQIF